MKKFLSAATVFVLSVSAFAEPTVASYISPASPIEGGYTKTLVLDDGTLEYITVFTNVQQTFTWNVPANIKDGKIDYLVVAGGGGGGAYHGGGGGAGGMLSGTIESIADISSFAVTVGDGGEGGSNKLRGSNGEDSILLYGEKSIRAIGGGGGGGLDEGYGADGGSGGGAVGHKKAKPAGAQNGGVGTPGQGNDGASRTEKTGDGSGCGGGGAGAPATERNGGAGLPSMITGSEVYYAGGGGAGGYTFTTANGIGGIGGGANGGAKTAPGSHAQQSSGGGGGGGGYPDGTTGAGGNGGSGVVVLRYALVDDGAFDGISVEVGGERNEDGNPSGVFYKELPVNNTFTHPKYTILRDGVRAVCVGWELWNYQGEKIRSLESDNEEVVPEEVVFVRNDDEKGVILKWLFVREYYVSTTAAYATSAETCTRGGFVKDKTGWYREGDEIELTVADMRNFIGWGGWGGGELEQIVPLCLRWYLPLGQSLWCA